MYDHLMRFASEADAIATFKTVPSLADKAAILDRFNTMKTLVT